jgi:hypothetical protein
VVATEAQPGEYVLRTTFAASCVDALWNRDTHSHFPPYLHLRRQASLSGSSSGIAPDWSALSELLRVPGGPYGRPHLRPFWKGKRTANQEWLGDNLAGSYSPASLRSTMLLIVEIDDQKHYTLREEHWKLAREHLLFEERMDVLALAGFLFRDFSITSATTPTADDLVSVFRGYFGYSSNDDSEFEYLYDVTEPPDSEPWFEPFETSS